MVHIGGMSESIYPIGNAQIKDNCAALMTGNHILLRIHLLKYVWAIPFFGYITHTHTHTPTTYNHVAIYGREGIKIHYCQLGNIYINKTWLIIKNPQHFTISNKTSYADSLSITNLTLKMFLELVLFVLVLQSELLG